MKQLLIYKTDKKVLLLIVVLILLAVSIIYRVLNPFEQQRVKQLKYTGKQPVKEKKNRVTAEKASPSRALILEFLNKKQVKAIVHKDLFKTYRPEPGIPEQTPASLTDTPNGVQEKALTPIRKDPVLEAKEYLSSYRLYGTYKSEKTKAVFLAKDKLVLVARTGDRLDGKYLIDDIQENHIRIRALDINETIHLDMREFNNE